MRATRFGDLWFIDHVEVSIGPYLVVVLVIVDGMSILLWVCCQKHKERESTVEALERCCGEWNVQPDAVCGDEYSIPKPGAEPGHAILK